MWLTQQERVAFVVLGALALVGLGLLAWLQRPPPSLHFAWERETVAATPAQAAQWNEALRRARHVDVNTATVAELERLPQVGPTLAHRIVAYRQRHGRFRTLEELEQVEGIGPKTSKALEEYVRVH